MTRVSSALSVLMETWARRAAREFLETKDSPARWAPMEKTAQMVPKVKPVFQVWLEIKDLLVQLENAVSAGLRVLAVERATSELPVQLGRLACLVLPVR